MVNRKVLLMCPKCYKIVHFAPLEETKKCENGHEVINFYNVPMKKDSNEKKTQTDNRR